LSELTEGQTPIPKALRIRDLAGHLQDVVSAGLDVPDITLPYYKSDRATVHMHVVGKRQIVPLHVHLRAEETSVIVSGEPDVTLTYLEGREIRTEAAIEKPGSLIYSPVLCAHAWSNPADALQGNLVFAIPPFTGNLYISPTDSRLTPLARPPLRSRPEELIALLRASGRSVFSRVLPGMQGTMREVALTGQTELPAEPGEPNIAYVRRGTGRVGTSAVDLQPVRAQHLISAEGALQLHGTEDDPLVVLVFRPEYDASAGIEGTSSAATERP